MYENPDTIDGTPQPKRKAGLMPTVWVYCLVALLAIMALLLVVSRSLSDILNISKDTRDVVLPAVIDRQRTAINLERLGRFAETVYRSDDAKDVREFRLAARILSQDAAFEENENLKQQVNAAYSDIETIAYLRDEQRTFDAQSTEILLSFAPGMDSSNQILSLSHGAEMIRLLFVAATTKSHETLTHLKNQFSKMAEASPHPAPIAAAFAATDQFFSLRDKSIMTAATSKEMWRQVNLTLEQLTDSLSINAAVTANDQFTTITEKAASAMQSGLLATGALLLAFLILIYLTQRDIFIPIVRYVHELDRIGRGEPVKTLPQARIRELDDIRNAINRSAILMTQLATRTKEMREANEALESEIVIREQTQQELAQAKERAESADRAKSDFLAGMSHEIRTPMNTILGMADLMLETNPTPIQRQYIEVSQSSGKMLMGIINDVLDLSKIEAGEVRLEDARIDLDALIYDTLEIVTGRIQQKGLSLTTDIGDDVPRQFIGDPIRLRQVLVNLIDNAAKFTNQGEIHLAINQGDSNHPGRLTFAVIDSGIGIPENVQSHIFHRFTQADASTTRKYGGTGLGLAICQRLVELMGGTIKLESAPGEGATFYFTLDFAIQPSEPGLPLAPPLDVHNLTDMLSHMPRDLLIAEDSDSNRALLELYFKETSCRLDFAVNGQEAVEKFKAARYDMVLMDIQMPLMDGYEATQAIRLHEKLSQAPPTPIVAVTANAFKEDLDRCLAAGCSDYMAKPVKKVNLLQRVVMHTTSNSDTLPAKQAPGHSDAES